MEKAEVIKNIQATERNTKLKMVYVNWDNKQSEAEIYIGTDGYDLSGSGLSWVKGYKNKLCKYSGKKITLGGAYYLEKGLYLQVQQPKTLLPYMIHISRIISLTRI